MELELVVLESRGPQTPLREAAAIVPMGSEAPEGYAVVGRVKLPDDLAEQVKVFFVGGIIQFSRDNMLALLAAMGRTSYKAGIEHERQRAEEEREYTS
jgi:hypothetical protein